MTEDGGSIYGLRTVIEGLDEWDKGRDDEGMTKGWR